MGMAQWVRRVSGAAGGEQGSLSFAGRVPMVLVAAALGQLGVGIWSFGQSSAEIRGHDRQIAELGRRQDALEARQAVLTQHIADRGDQIGRALADLLARGAMAERMLERTERRLDAIEARSRRSGVAPSHPDPG